MIGFLNNFDNNTKQGLENYSFEKKWGLEKVKGLKMCNKINIHEFIKDEN